jgi:hypothetical protein
MQVTYLRIPYIVSTGTSAEKMLGNIITSAEGSEEKTESANKMRETSNNSSQIYNQHLVDKKGHN